MSNEIRGKVSATYSNEFTAKTALDAVKTRSGIDTHDIFLVAPHDNEFDNSLESDDKQVGFFMLKTHLLSATIGVILGLISAGVLAFYGPAYTQSSPVLTAIALSILGFFVGLLIAGLVSLRPDQDAVVNQTRDDSQEGNWVVVVNSPSHEKTQLAYDVLSETSDSVTSSY